LKKLKKLTLHANEIEKEKVIELNRWNSRQRDGVSVIFLQ
jgi:hypothetical protein